MTGPAGREEVLYMDNLSRISDGNGKGRLALHRDAFLLCCLLVCFAPACWSGGLNWGALFDTGRPPSADVKKYQARVLELAKANTGKKFTAVEKIVSEGKLPTEPGVARSRAATGDIPMLLKLSVCARTAPEPGLKKECRQAALRGLREWALVYKPAGNPINENSLVPWIQAWDIMNPLLTEDERQPLEAFARALVAAGDKFYGGMKVSDGRYYNNWASWRLCVRGLVSAALNDEALLRSSRDLAEAQISHNILPDGSTFDLHQRDALLYHVYDLEALTLLAAQMPEDFLPAGARAAVASAVGYLEPFYTGKKVHIEFAGSKVPFDIKRKENAMPDYQNAPWKPEHARKLLRLARTVFPGVAKWSGSVVDEQYDPMLKLQAAALEQQGAGAVPK